MNLNELAKQIHLANHKWWHDSNGNRLERNFQELLMLAISEVSEAMEGERKDLMDDHLPHRKMAEVEMADTVIRLLDIAAGFKIVLFDLSDSKVKAPLPENKGQILFDIVETIVAVEAEPSIISHSIWCIQVYCKKHSYDLEGAIQEKLQYNATRLDHTHEARNAPGGKKF